MSRFVCLVAILLACSQAVQAILELRAIGLPGFENGQNGPPARVPGLLRELNRQLRGVITDVLNDQSRHSLAGQKEIVAELQAAGWNELPSQKWNAYGESARSALTSGQGTIRES
jgi:hypothetical protein